MSTENTPVKQMLQILDELGLDWTRVRTEIILNLDPRSWDNRAGDPFNVTDMAWSVQLNIEIPVGLIRQDKVAEIQHKLELARFKRDD